MKAIILAAGRGSRMNELTSDKPKCMVEFKGRPLLEWQLGALIDSGVKDIGVVCGYKKEKIVDQRISRFFPNNEWESTNMVFSLLCAQEWLSGDDFLVSYSDIFYDAKIVKSLLGSASDISLTYDKNFAELWRSRFSNPLSDLESFRIGDDGFLKKIGGRASSLDEIQGQFMGLLKFTPSGFSRMREIISAYDIRKLDCTSSLQILIESGVKIEGVGIEEMWGEIDNQNDLKLYEKLY